MVRLFGQDYSKKDLLKKVGRLAQIAGVRLVTLDEGIERGVRVLEFRTGGGLVFDVLVDRAFDIGRCDYNSMAIGWQSAVGFAHPAYYEPEGFGFLRSFGGGLLTTCGLDHVGGGAEDTAAQYFYPPKPTETYGLHGRISNRPARLVGYGERWDGDECVLWAEGEVLQASTMGEVLLLHRRIEAHVGGLQIHIRDTVTNTSPYVTPHMLLYHVNLGFPVVDEGSEILLPTRKITPIADFPVNGYQHLEAPDATYTERVYEYEPIADAAGKVTAGIVNRRTGIGAYQVYQRDQLPHPVLWRMLGEQNYVVGLEPSTNRIGGRQDARRRGELIQLAPDEQREYTLELGVLPDSAAIEAFAVRVQLVMDGGE